MMIMKVVEANLEAIKKAYLEKLDPTWKILDVGGGDQPIKLATHVIDIQPYAKTGRLGVMGRVKEDQRFTKDTWTQMNICDGKWPYPDKFFDFVWSTQVLEDIRDPIGVCKEMMRVGKRGYINTPGKLAELICGMNQEPLAEHYNGYWHHRWLVSREGDKLIFEQKTAYATSVKWADPLLVEIINNNPTLGYVELYWEDDFKVEEQFSLSGADNFKELKSFIEDVKRRHS